MARLATNHEAERRLTLLKAAFREVAEKGFSNVTLEGIAARASVSKGVTLYYFASKEDLFCGLAARREAFRVIDERFYAGCREVDGSIVEEGMRRGVFMARDPGEAASTLRAIFDGLMLQLLAEKDPEATFEKYRDRCERE